MIHMSGQADVFLWEKAFPQSESTLITDFITGQMHAGQCASCITQAATVLGAFPLTILGGCGPRSWISNSNISALFLDPLSVPAIFLHVFPKAHFLTSIPSLNPIIPVKQITGHLSAKPEPSTNSVGNRKGHHYASRQEWKSKHPCPLHLGI